MTDEEKIGGTAWELQEAIRLMGEAVASGDAEQIATAMRRHAEALSNQATEKMAKPLVASFERSVENIIEKYVGPLTEALNAARVHEDQRFGYALRELQAETLKGDAWRDAASKDIQSVLVTLQEVVTLTGKQSKDIAALKRGQTRIDKRAKEYYDKNATRINTVEAAIADISQILANRPAQRLAEKEAEREIIVGLTVEEVLRRLGAEQAGDGKQ